MNAMLGPITLPLEIPDQSPCLTIADAERALATWTDLAPRRAQKMRTALSTAARALAPGQHRTAAAAAVPLSCDSLSALLKAPPATFGLSRSRMTSLCSELRYILRRLGLHQRPTHGVSMSSATLRACHAALPEFRQLAILDFLRFLDAEGIAAEAVDTGTLSAYQAHCIGRTLCRDPGARIRNIVATWNWAHQHVPDWPGKPLIREGRTDRYSLRFDSYPASFQQDLENYTQRLARADLKRRLPARIFTEQGYDRRRAQRPLQPASVSMRRWMIRCSAAALVRKGIDPQSLTTLRDLVDPLDHAETIIQFFLDRNGGHPGSMVAKVAQTLHLLARDHCGLLDEHVPCLADWAKWVKPKEPVGMTDKNRRRLRVLIQPRVRAMLLCFPGELMRRAASRELTPDAAARLVMYATAMEILLVSPMRRGNLAGLRIDRHLHRPDPRKSRFTHILIDADEVKNGRAIEFPLPPESQKLIETYVTRYRHHLVDPGNPYLFGAGGKQRSAQHLGEWLSGCITRETGAEFNVHLARHFAAWNFLRTHPGQYEVVRQVLGHRSINTTIAHYVGLEAESAAQHFDATVLRDRQSVKKIAAHAFRSGLGGLQVGGGRAGR